MDSARSLVDHALRSEGYILQMHPEFSPFALQRMSLNDTVILDELPELCQGRAHRCKPGRVAHARSKITSKF
jgi:hypothetical protein